MLYSSYASRFSQLNVHFIQGLKKAGIYIPNTNLDFPTWIQLNVKFLQGLTRTGVYIPNTLLDFANWMYSLYKVYWFNRGESLYS